MYRPNEIKTGLFGLWGWRQNWDPTEFQIGAALVASSSGQYFQEAHPLLTLANVKGVAPDFEDVTFADWAIATPYLLGAEVTDDDKAYRAKADNTGLKPGDNPTEWLEFSLFDEWLTQKTQASILKAVRTFWDEKMASQTARNILENRTLFNGAGAMDDLVTNEEKLVGFELVPIRSKGVTVKLDKVGLQFAGAGEVKMYLMHSSRRAPVKEITFTRSVDEGMEWLIPTEELYLPYVGPNNDAGGSWYLVYNQNELATASMQAINRGVDLSAKPITCSTREDYSSPRLLSRYLEVYPFEAPGTAPSTGAELWDIKANAYTPSSNYGLNIQLTVQTDITELVLEQKEAFQSVIGLQVAADFLREFAYNPEFKVSRSSVNLSKMEILYELDGDSQSEKNSGLGYQLEQAIEALKLDISGLSRVCFPKKNGGIRHTVI